MTTTDLNYDGTPQLNRQRQLTEDGVPNIAHKEDRQLPSTTSRRSATAQIFQDLAKVYAKGEKLKEALGDMEPAGFIPIEEGADQTSIAAERFNATASGHGTIITFGMYQQAVDLISQKNWEIRGKYIRMDIPISPEVHNRAVNEAQGGSKKDRDTLSQFIDGLGIAGVLLSFFTGSIFDTQIFNTLSVESGAKATAAIRIPFGVAILLEVGVKAVQIVTMFKEMNDIDLPEDIEKTVSLMDGNPEARREAFNNAGVDYDEFVANQEMADAKQIVSYTGDFIARNGGMLDDTRTLDHWVAYQSVASNQNTVRSAINVADVFTEEFADIRSQFTSEANRSSSGGIEGAVSNFLESDPFSDIYSDLASNVLTLSETSDTMYDDIAQSFFYSVSDEELCCLLQIAGESLDPEMLRTIAKIARIAATSLSGNLTTLENIGRKALSNIFKDAIYELIAQMNRLYDKVIRKLNEIFTPDLPGLETCIGLFTLGRVFIHVAVSIRQRIDALLQNVLDAIIDFGAPRQGTWEIAADRRHLVGIAKLLTTISFRLEAVQHCANRPPVATSVGPEDRGIAIEQAADQIINTIIENPEPVLSIPEPVLERYFPNLEPRRSARYGFTYGRRMTQNLSETADTVTDTCTDRMTQDEIQKSVDALKSAVTTAFRVNE